MSARPFLIWTPIFLLLTAAFVSPAVWNGFPLVFPDTGGYLARPFEGRLEMGRSAFYGAVLAAAIALELDFFPVVVLQAAMAAWLLVRTMWVLGFGQRPLLILSVGLAVAVLTGLPWYAAQLLPDMLTGIATLSLYLLAFHAERMRSWERIALAATVGISAAAHMSTLALAIGLFAALAILYPVAMKLRLPRPSLRWPAIAVAVSLLGAPLSNSVIAGRFAFTPGGSNFLFARIVEDGIAAQFLAERCPDAKIRACEFRNDLPARGEDWLWDSNSPLQRPGGLGGWAEFEDEAGRIFRESLAAYPMEHLKSAAMNVARQFVMFATGDGLTEWAWHTQWILGEYAPGALQSYLTARQQAQDWDFSRLNLVHITVALISVALLPFIVFAASGRIPRPIAALALWVLLALAGNAVICGIFSIPHHRYQGRLVWLAPFTVAVAFAVWQQKQLAKSHKVA